MLGLWRCVLSVGMVAVLAAPGVARAACTGGGALNGSYSLNVTGASTAGYAKYLNGALTFNGACGVSGTALVGEPNVAAAVNAAVSGSYAQNADGTVAISLTLPNVAKPETYLVYVSQVYSEALGEETDPSAVATIDLKPQVTVAGSPAPYTNASLAGSWTASCRGTAGSFSDLNVFTADGHGNIANGIDASNNNAQYFNLPYTGAYAVQANGVVTGNVTVGGATYGYAGTISNNGNDFDYVYTQPVSAPQAFVGCAAKRVAPPPSFSCHVAYTAGPTVLGVFQGGVTIANTGVTPINSWTLQWSFANGQRIFSVWNGNASQSGANVTITNTASNGTIPAGGSYNGVGFLAVAGFTNATPASFSVNGVTCH